MWCSQTYLGKPDPKSDLFLYYLWEKDLGQNNLPEQVLKGLRHKGYDLEDEGSAIVPMDDDSDAVSKEKRKMFRDYWENFKDHTPGIFFCKKPLRDLDPPHVESLFFNIKVEILSDPKKTLSLFTQLHEICRVTIDQKSKVGGKWDVSSLSENIVKAYGFELG